MPTALDPASPAAAPHRAARSAGSPQVFGLAVGGLATAAYLASLLVRAAGSTAVPVASITALLLLGATPLVERAARWAGSARPERAAAWSFVGVAPLLFLGAKIAIGNEPVISSHWRCGSGDIGFMLLSPIAVALVGALGALVAFAVTSSRERAGGGPWSGLFARGVLILGGILVAAATFRAARHPSTDHARAYLDTLPTVAVLPPIDPAAVKTVIPTRGESVPLEQTEDELHFGDITARRQCSASSCTITLRRNEGLFPPDRKWDSAGNIPAEGNVIVQHDVKHGFWIFGGTSAFRDRDLQVSDISVQDLGDELSAPGGWILGGAAGLVVALALWQTRRRAGQRLLRIEAARAGTLGDNGWITLHDDTPAWRASPDLALAAGPVLLLGRGGRGGAAGAYRSEGAAGGDEIVAGAREDIVQALRSRMRDLDAVGIVAVVLTAAPLLAAWSSGLLF